MSAQIAVNSVVMAPRHRVSDWIVLLFSISGWKRISRKTPATTIVLEWSRAETGVGPSMAEGSHDMEEKKPEKRLFLEFREIDKY